MHDQRFQTNLHDSNLNRKIKNAPAVYVRNTINQISRTELDTDDLEMITVEISKRRSNCLLLIVCIDLQTQRLNYLMLMKN